MHALVVYYREVVRVPVRTLAEEIGISKTALDQFHKLHSHPGEIWPQLRDWYMRTRQNRAATEYQTPPDLFVDSALFTLREFSARERAQALPAVVKMYRELYARFDRPLPEWLERLTEIANQGEGA